MSLTFSFSSGSNKIRCGDDQWTCSRRLFVTLGGLSFLAVPQSGKAVSPRRPTSAEVEKAVTVDWPPTFPFEANDFRRYDESPDLDFYQLPKLVYHIDDQARRALEEYYNSLIRTRFRDKKPDVLDLCSSWVSYLPKDYKRDPDGPRVAGMGMNEAELKLNPQLTEYFVRDLNSNPSIPYETESFDLVVCALSMDYLIKPLDVLKEVRRVLRPNGLCVIAFSNRLFSTKAVAHWTASGDLDHVYAVGCYFHYTGGYSSPSGEL